MNPLSIPLPVAVRRQGEIIGIVAGIVCFPVALYVGAMEGLFPNGPAALVLPIVILTAIAGAIASLTADESKAPDIGGVPLRVGARAGFIASLVAGAFTVLASTFHSFGIGSPASVESNFGIFKLLLPSSPASRVIVLALLALPPSIFFGLTGALLAGMLKTKAPGVNRRAGFLWKLALFLRRVSLWECSAVKHSPVSLKSAVERIFRENTLWAGG